MSTVVDGAGALLLAQQERYDEAVRLYRQHHVLVHRVQEELEELAEELIDQEGWTKDVREGVREWVSDRGVSWRALRRARFDPAKGQKQLLAALTNRVRLGLHEALPPIPPYTFHSPTIERIPPLFTFLPYPQHRDALGRPLAVVTLRQVKRDFSQPDAHLEDGASKPVIAGTEGLVRVAWWIAEHGRRVVRDLAAKRLAAEKQERGRRRSKGKENASAPMEIDPTSFEGEEVVKGYAVIVDVKGAGLSNLQLELLPRLIDIHHHQFPGLVSAIFIVNSTWSSQALWSGLKRVLPTAALEKITWLDSTSKQGIAEMSQLFDLQTLPMILGGQGDHDPAASEDIMLQRYDLPAAEGVRLNGRSVSESAKDRCSSSSVASSPTTTLSHSTSFESIADVYYSARNTPAPSRPATPGNALQLSGAGRRHSAGQNQTNLGFRDLRMTRAQGARRRESETVVEREVGTNALGLEPEHRRTAQGVGQSIARKRTRSQSRPSSPSVSPESLRKDAQTPMERIKSLADFRLYLSPSKRANMDLLLGSDDEEEVDHLQQRNQSSARRRPQINPVIPARLSVLQANPGGARSYSASLTQHHTEGLVKSASQDPPRRREDTLPEPIIVPASNWAEDPPQTSGPPPDSQRSISAYDAATNPTFGYPTVVEGSALRPRYGRKRKRDLAKALLYLFLLRLASLREWIDILLHSFGLSGRDHRHKRQRSQGSYTNPEMAFRQGPPPVAGATSKSLTRFDRDGKVADRSFIWMIFTLLLLRGGIPLGWETTVSTVWDGWSKLKSTLMR